MFKCLVLGAFVTQAIVKDCYGQLQPLPYDSELNTIEQSASPLENDFSAELTVQKDGQYPIYASRLNFSLGDSFASKSPTGFPSNYVGWKRDADYVVAEGIGAYKLHSRKLSWINAMRSCIDEGGNLAVIRSDFEETVILGMMGKKSIGLAWVGYHDLFKEGDWFSVTGEPLAQAGWSPWSTEYPINPIPNNGHCGELKGGRGGLVNNGCALLQPFICKILID